MSAETGEALKTLMEQAQAHLKEGAFEEAVEAFSACLVMSPRQAKAYQGRGLARLQLKEWEQAASDFARAKDIDPDDLENWIGLGISLASNERVYEAIDVFDGLLKKNPRSARGHIQAGLLYFKLCIPAKGRKHMEAALQCRPTPAERRFIESVLKEESALDKKRYHRPDFEELRRKNTGGISFHWMDRVARFFKTLFQGSSSKTG